MTQESRIIIDGPLCLGFKIDNNCIRYQQTKNKISPFFIIALKSFISYFIFNEINLKLSTHDELHYIWNGNKQFKMPANTLERTRILWNVNQYFEIETNNLELIMNYLG